MPTLLIIDDEPNLLYSLKKALQSDSLRVITAETASEGVAAFAEHKPDAVVLDVRLPDRSGIEAFAEMREIDPRTPVTIITAFSTTDMAIEAMKHGAFEYLLKPVDLDKLQTVVHQSLEISRMRHVPAVLHIDADEPNADRIVGTSPSMQEVYKAIGKVATQNVNVLIVGESGTGKELVARAIYHHSHRSNAPFLAINCAAIPDALLESEMFGHEAGAFTGADRQRIGKFEQVDGGTLFLDEVGDMSPSTQAKVLRLLQDGCFERVGGTQTIRSDVRVIAATNRNLEEMIETGQFRRDLYYRLRVFSIELPALRDRREDLPLLVEYFLKVYRKEFNKQIDKVAPEAMELIYNYPWPGNVRELQNAIKYAMVHAVGDTITSKCLPMDRHRGETEPPPNDAATPMGGDLIAYIRQLLESGEKDVYRKLHTNLDRLILEQTFDVCQGSQVRAAELLGISRSTLRSRISELGMTFEKRISIDNADARTKS